MGKFWKITRLVLAGAGLLLVLAVVFNFLVLPRLMNSQALKAKIRTVARQQVNAQVDFKRLDLRFLPRPHVVLSGVVLSIPPDIKAAAEVVKIYPEIFPLFSGKVRLAAARLELAELDLAIPEEPAKIKEPAGDFTLAELAKHIQTAISALPEIKTPWPKLRIINSRVAFRYGNRKALELEKVNGALLGPPQKRLMTFSCESNFWENITISAFLDRRTSVGNAHIQLSRLRPHELIAYLLPGAAFQFDSAPASLDIRLKTDGPGQARAQVKGAFPSLKLQRSGQTFDIQCRRIEGSLAVTGDALDLTVSQLSLEYPGMGLSAQLTVTPSIPRVALRVEGRRVDVNALRQVALGLLGQNETVQDIFDVVRGGKVPLITVTSEGKSAAELGDMDRLVIQGKMEAGEIYVSSGQLDLKEASGEAVISRGILVGNNLSARLGNSRGRHGQLRLGLVGEADPFHLDIDVQADLAELPPVLGRLVDNRSFQQQLALLKEFKGSAHGRLVLGESTEDVNVKVDVDSIHLEARYQPIPFPVKVSAGSCSYRDTGFKVGELTGSLGTSSFTGLNGAVDWQKAPYLQIDSGRLDIVLKDLLPWLSSYKQMAGLREYYAGGKGAVTLASISLKGPLFSPRQWRFAASGKVADLVLNQPSPSAPTTFVSTEVTADNQIFSFTNAQVRWLDSELTMSGGHRDYLEAFDKNGRLTMKGRLGVRTMAWLSRHTLFPAQIKLRPLTLSAAQLDWDESGKTAFTASVVTDKGGQVSLDLVYSPDELNMRKLIIDDQQSHATIGFVLREKAIDLSFEGNLTKASMDWVLAKNDILDGSIKGSFKTHIDVDHPQGSTARGQLEGTDLNSVWGFGFPVKIHRFSLSADGSRIDLQSAELSWQDSAMQLEGEVSFGAPKIAADLRLTADEINGDALRKVLGQGTQEPETSSPQETAWSSPIDGRLSVKTKRFLYAGYTWSPLQADLSLSEKGLDVDVTEAELCGISTPGTIHVSPQKVIQLDFKPVSVSKQLEHTLPCLFGDMMKLEGRYDLNGRITGKASADELIKSLRGDLIFDAEKGRFYHDILILKVMEYLSTAKVITQDLQETQVRGESFRSAHTRARLENDKMVFEEMAMDSDTIKLAGQGEMNFADHSIDFKILVAVVKTVNRVLDKVPLLGGIFSDMLSVPVRVKGDWKDPSVVPLSPSAVGSELTGIMKKVLSFGRRGKQP